MDDMISRAYVLAEYDRQHKGPPGGARKIIEDAPTIDAITVEWLKQWRDKLKGMGEYQRERAEDISFVLGLWQKERRRECEK